MKKRVVAISIAICLLVASVAVGSLFLASGQSAVQGDIINYDSVGDLDVDGARLTKIAEQSDNYDEFKVTLTIETKATVEKSADIVLLLDCSGSMAGTRLTSLKSSASDLAEILLNEESNNRLALVTFSGSTSSNNPGANVNVVSNLVSYNNGAGLQTIQNGINAINATGGTHTQSGIKTANEVLSTSTADEKIVIVLTDGDPTFGYTPSTYTVNHTETTTTSARTGRATTTATHEITDVTAYNYNSSSGIGSQNSYTMSAYCSECAKNVTATAYCSTGAIFESNLGKEAGYTYYTIGYEVAEGSAAETTMKAVASGNYYYPADSTNLSGVFAQIGAEIDVIIEAGSRVSDPMGDMLDLVYNGTELVKASDSNLTDGDYYVSSGSIVWNDETETIDWTLGTVYKDTPVTMTYKVFLDVEAPGFEEDKFYNTNGDTVFTFMRTIDSEEKTMNFNVPQVRGWVGELNKAGYLVNIDGEPIDAQGNIVDGIEDAEVLYDVTPIINERNGENRWRLRTERTITANELPNYEIYGDGSETVTQTDKDDIFIAYFPYYISNQTIQIEHYFQDIEAAYNLGYTEIDSIKFAETKNASSYVLSNSTEYTLPDGLTYDSTIKGSVSEVSFNENGQTDFTLKLYYTRAKSTVDVEYYLENVRTSTEETRSFTHMTAYDETLDISFGETILSADFAQAFTNAMANNGIVVAYDSTHAESVNSTAFTNEQTGPSPATLKLYFLRAESNLVVEHYFQQDVKLGKTDSDGYPLTADNSVDGIIYVGETKTDSEYILENQVGYAYKDITGKSVKSVTCTVEGETLKLKIYYERVPEQKLEVKHYFEQLNGEYTQDAAIDAGKKDVLINHKYYASDYDVTNRTGISGDFSGYTYNTQLSDNYAEYTNENTNADLVLNLYYDLAEAEYTVQYYFETLEGTWNMDADLTVNDKILFGGTKNSSAYDNEFEGYVYDFSDERNVSEVTYNNVNGSGLILKLYYDLRRDNVDVRYYKENPRTGVFEEQTTDSIENILIRYGETVSITNTDATYASKYPAYEYIQTDDTVESINWAQCDSGIKTIKLYYEAIPMEVKIEYYVETLKENNGEVSTEYVKNGKTISLGQAYYGDTFNGTDYHMANYAVLGYTFNENHTNSINNVSYGANGLNPGDTIKLYYSLKEGSAVVQYRDEAFANDDENGYLGQTAKNNLYYGQGYSIQSPDYEGYELVNSDKSVISGTIESESAFEIVYYRKKDVNYRVEHYYTDAESYPQYQLDEDATDNFTGKYFDVINSEIEVKTRNNEYVMTSMENYPLTLNDGENVIKVYYIKNVYNYTVEYYFDNVLDADLTDTFTATLNSVIDEYTDKVKTGYHYTTDSINNEGLVISGIPSEMIIKVYYEKNTSEYSVEHYFEQLNGTYVKDNSKTVSNVAFAYGDTAYASDYALLIDGYGYNAEHTDAISVLMFNADEPSGTVLKLYYDLGEYQLNIKYLDKADETSVHEAYAGTYLYGAAYSVEFPNVTGYTLSESENTGVNGILKQNMEITVYYEKADFNYTVNYYYSNVLDETATETGSAKYMSEITEYVDKPKTGYEFSKVNPEMLTISENEEENIINVYYVKSNFGYRVEYYYDDILALNATEIYTALYESKITSYIDKRITGYELEQVSPTELVITENEQENVIRVYYKMKEVPFTVEHYFETLEGNYDINSELTEEDTFTIGETKYAADYVGEFEGYTYNTNNIQSVNEIHFIEDTPDGTVLKLYYELNEYQLSVNYLDADDDKELAKPYIEKYSHGESYNIASPEITGYVLVDDGQENVEGIVVGNTEITVYYERANFDYVINYFYDGEKDENSTENLSAKFEDIITDYPDKPKTGYEFSEVSPESLTISCDESENVINVYYVRSSFEYRTEYYYDDLLDIEATETGEALYGDTITEYEDKRPAGYDLDEVTPAELVITEDEQENVIRVYYESRKVPFSVEYYFETLEGDFKIDGTKTVNGIFTIGEKKYSSNYAELFEGYIYNAEHENSVNEISFENDEITQLQTLRLYYELGEYQINIKYLDMEDDSDVAEAYVSEYSYGEEYKVESPQVVGYDFVDETQKTIIGIAEENQEIAVYYQKEDYAYTINYYYDGVIDEAATETGTAEFKTVIAKYPNKIKTGYEIEKITPQVLVISENNSENVINIYYVKSSYKYRVEYYYDDILNLNATETGEAFYGDVISEYEDKCVDGYEFVEASPKALTIMQNSSENVIRVYYKTKKAPFVVEYYIQNENGEFVLDETRTIEGISSVGDIKLANEYVEPIDGYVYNENNQLAVNQIQLSEDSQETLKLFYEQSDYSIVIRYEDENGNPIQEPEVIDVKKGTEYKVEIPEIEGYEPIIEENVIIEGKAPAGDTETVVKYRKVEPKVLGVVEELFTENPNTGEAHPTLVLIALILLTFSATALVFIKTEIKKKSK